MANIIDAKVVGKATKANADFRIGTDVSIPVEVVAYDLDEVKKIPVIGPDKKMSVIKGVSVEGTVYAWR